MTSSNRAARSYGTASPPVNMHRSDERSAVSIAGDFNIMRNWVLTHASTVTRSRSIARITASASKRSCTTVGQPSTAGVTCAVQMPKPNGAGIALRNTSSPVIAPASAASWWKYIHRFCVCITHFGMPVVPDVEFTRKRSSAP